MPKPPKPPKAFDVWFVAANTVYKAVPYNVVADWTQSERLAKTDMVRPTGTSDPWVAVSDYELLADYLPRPKVRVVSLSTGAATTVEAARPGEQPAAPADAVATAEEPIELPDPPQPRFRDRDGDDEVDLIPLIDISMVLLVFFVLYSAAGALSPVDVPEMKYAGQLSADPNSVTITIEKKNTDEVYYSVRVGTGGPRAGYEQLATPEDALDELDVLLKDVPGKPEVRIACRKDLPRERVYELRRELEQLQKDGKINNIVATVVEPPDKK